MATAQDVCSLSLSEILNDDATQTPAAADLNFALTKLIDLLDHLQLDPTTTIGLREFTYTPSSGAQSITIGSAISSTLTSSSTTATVTTSQNHGMIVGDVVVISGASQTEYNGTYTVATVPSLTTFTYTFAGSLTSPATGSPLVSPNIVTPMPVRLEESSFCRLGGVDFLIGFAPSFEDYNAQPIKSNQGYPTKCWYNTDTTSQIGRLYLWPASNGAELHIWIRQVPVSGFSTLALGTTLTLPMGAKKMLVDILSGEMLDSYNVPNPAYNQIKQKAMLSLRKWKRANVRIRELMMPSNLGRFTANSYTS